jgi:D-glycero-alpha-D-manno-heptose-7-phosphate kinase
MTFSSQAPTRVDLAGGTLDIWPLYLFHENAQTINVAIQCNARCRLTPRRDGAIHLISRDLGREERFPSLGTLTQAKKFRLPLLARLVEEFSELEVRKSPGDRTKKQVLRRYAPQDDHMRLGKTATGWKQGFTLETDSDSPAGAGLGGSSSLNIAICGALSQFMEKKLSKEKLIELAGDVEAQVLGVPTGEQDYYAAAYGGVQAIRFGAGEIVSERLAVNYTEIAARGVLCYTGDSRNSGINNWEVMKAHIDGNRSVVRHFDRIAAIAVAMRSALEQNDWQETARLLNQEWEARKRNHPGITTPGIERLIRLARRNGARAAKVCGAGGGGCVFFFCEPGAKRDVETALRRAGARVMPFAVTARGLTVRAVEPGFASSESVNPRARVVGDATAPSRSRL